MSAAEADRVVAAADRLSARLHEARQAIGRVIFGQETVVEQTLITVLSEKTLPIPELASEVQAVRGFSVIATANNRDKGVNELSAALKRRFNTVVLPVPASEDDEVAIVVKRVAEMGRALQLPAEPPALKEVRRIVQIFRELRNGKTEDGKTQIKSPTATLSSGTRGFVSG